MLTILFYGPQVTFHFMDCVQHMVKDRIDQTNYLTLMHIDAMKKVGTHIELFNVATSDKSEQSWK